MWYKSQANITRYLIFMFSDRLLTGIKSNFMYTHLTFERLDYEGLNLWTIYEPITENLKKNIKYKYIF